MIVVDLVANGGLADFKRISTIEIRSGYRVRGALSKVEWCYSEQQQRGQQFPHRSFLAYPPVNSGSIIATMSSSVSCTKEAMKQRMAVFGLGFLSSCMPLKMK